MISPDLKMLTLMVILTEKEIKLMDKRKTD